MGKHQPKPPDPNQVAGAQFAGNIASGMAGSALSNVNQVTPYGTLNYSQTGMTSITDPYTGKQISIPQYTATQTLSPQEQGIYNTNTQTRQTLGNVASQGAGSLKLDTGNTQDYANALFGRMNPLLDQRRQQLQTQLANQGLQPGSVAYNRAMDEADRQENDAHMAAILNAGQEQNRVSDLNSSRINQLNALMNIAKNQNPGFIGTPSRNVGDVNYGNIAQNSYADQVARWKNGQDNALQWAGFGLGLLSDVRAKTDIQPVGTLYEYRYLDDPPEKRRIGVMAQEIEHIRPEAVSVDDQGLKRVHYGRLFELGEY
ncbi:hypothetical protein B488_05160 [Liberibacter crescens BT-1]|uniref:Peptidase S74 domain-containing protein n=1 Tax=Liberibacter crescens (strain BT-1) TaxID=1215343 RepID=L0EV41_LIBCB|nr:tail fiber domain-containing protein [Liberibacter crescens]AGA64508.1 hypothetical protein B488_05160 [Liberibacter crescens BT-1]AMC12663.1 hypothetical protein RL73_02675 [Liberibacter crescens]